MALQWDEAAGVPLSYRVERTKLSKDKTSLVVNASLTLADIPPAVFQHRLESIVRLVGQVVRMSVETVAIVSALPSR